MSLTALLAFIAVLAAPSLGQSWRNSNPSGGRGGNTYIDSLVGNINKKGGNNNCYDRCHRAWQINPNNYHIRGCVCSNYNFVNDRVQDSRRVGGRFGGQVSGNRCYDQCYDAWQINPNSYHVSGCVCSTYDFASGRLQGERLVGGQVGGNRCYDQCYNAWQINPNSYHVSGCVCSTYDFASRRLTGGQVGGNRCYDRCYDAWQINPNSYHVSGCVCSTYDFASGKVQGGRLTGGQVGGNRCYDQCYGAWQINPNSYHVSGCVCSTYDFASGRVQGGRRVGGHIGGQVGGNRCYDQCYDAWQVNPNSYHVSGCVCSTYDFASGKLQDGRRVGGRFGGPTRGNRCYDQCYNAWQTNPNSYDISGCVCSTYNFNRRNQGGRRNGLCAPLMPSCNDVSGGYSNVYRWTYKYETRTCIKIRVRSSCAFSYGASSNLFKTYDDCSAHCSSTRTY